MRRIRHLAALAAVVIALAAACSSSDPALDTGSSRPSGTAPGATDPPGAGGGSSLVGPTFTLTSVEAGDAVSTLPAGVEAPTLVFAADGTVGVFDGCNRGSGTYELGATSITFRSVTLTAMGCEADVEALETAVTTVLGGTAGVERSGPELRLEVRDVTLVYVATP